MPIARRLRTLRLDKGMTQEYLAEAVKTSAKTIQRWEAGESAPDARKIQALANALGIKSSYLLADEDVDEKENLISDRVIRDGLIEVPVLRGDSAACCKDGFSIADLDADAMRYELIPEEWLNGPKGDKPPFIVVVEGDSMTNLINDGERILVNPNIKVTHGRIAVCCWNGYAIIRGIHFERNGDVRLRARNTAYEDIIIKADDIPYMLKFCGVVTECMGLARPVRGFF